VKTATDSSVPGQTVQTTVTRRILPVDSATSERKTPEFWEYIEKLPADWDRHILYLYRRTSDTGPLIPLEKCAGYMTMPDSTQVALNNREEVEFAVARKFGGGTYRLILKRGSERVTEGRIIVEGPPKAVQPQIFEQGQGPTVTTMGENGGIAAVANKAIDTMAGQEHQAVNLGLAMMNTAAGVVRNFADPGRGAPSEADQMLRMMMIKMMEKMIDRMDRVEAPVAPVVQGSNPIVDRILDSAVEKLLNPGPSGPVVNASAALVQQLPAVASHIGEAIREWRFGMEAQRDAILAQQRGAQSPNGAQVQRPVAHTVLPPPQPNPTPAPGVNVMDLIETKIIEILSEDLAIDDAAEESFGFLDRMDPAIVKHMVSLGEQGLMNLFQSRPILRQATTNLPRLVEFIRAFLKYAREKEADGGAAPNASALPN
jgi:hypothetical protein